MPITSTAHGSFRKYFQDFMKDEKIDASVMKQELKNIQDNYKLDNGKSIDEVSIEEFKEDLKQKCESITDYRSPKYNIYTCMYEVLSSYATRKKSKNSASIYLVLGKEDTASDEYTGVELTTRELFDFATNAVEDYLDGKIPFYEFHPSTGEVTTHKNAIVAKVGDKASMEARKNGTEKQQTEALKKYYESLLAKELKTVPDGAPSVQ